MFGQGNGDIVLDDVGCDGTETRLEDCPKAQMPAECTHTQDAGVSCESEWAKSYVTLCSNCMQVAAALLCATHIRLCII